MGLEEQIAEAIISAFDELGGDPQNAVSAARNHATIESWMQQETAMVAVAGGAEMIIPGLHALTIPAGISFLMHKMAYICRGIGTLSGAFIVETANYSDIRNILTLWGNSSYYNMHLLDFKAISLDVLEYALSDEGYGVLTEAIGNAQAQDVDAVTVNTMVILKSIVDEFAGDERSLKQLRTITDVDTAEELIAAAQNRVSTQTPTPLHKPLSRRLSTGLALRLATNLSARLPAKLVMGFIPVAGALVNAFFNAQTLMQVADIARKYYANSFTREDLLAFATPTAAGDAEADAE